MKSKTHQKALKCTGASIIGHAVDQDAPGNRPTKKLLAFAIALCAAVFLDGCNADDRLQNTFSNDGLLTTRDAVFGSFAACLLPSKQRNFTAAYSGPTGKCRLR